MERSGFMKIWRVIYPAFLLLAAYLAVYLMAMLAYGSFFQSSFPDIDSFMAAGGDIISMIALICGGLLAFMFYRRDCVVQSDFIRRHPVWFVPVIICGILVSHGLSILVSLAGLSGFLGTYTQTAHMLDTSGFIITAIKSVILVPLAEETAFRGLAFRRMYEYTGFWPAALISSLFFGVYHLNLMQGIYAFLFGILLCLVFKRFGNLAAPIAMHAAANAAAVLIEALKLDYPSLIVYLAVMAVTLAAAAFIIVKMIRKVPSQM